MLDCLTSNPEVWARTVLLVMFDENDGFFDHVPPPAPPCRGADGRLLGGSTVDIAGEHHLVRNPTEAKAERDDLMGRPYGLGPRVPLYVISPWSRGGWVNAQVFDHTSVIRFLEARFGVMEPNISPWRRAVCGDLTTCFDFASSNPRLDRLPETGSVARRAASLPGRTTPPTPAAPAAPVQAAGVRPSRALPYDLVVEEGVAGASLRLSFINRGSAAAVLHVYDRLRLAGPPRRYTVGAGASLEDGWPEGPYDLEVFGPNGFYRSFAGPGAPPGVRVLGAAAPGGALVALLTNKGDAPVRIQVSSTVYFPRAKPVAHVLAPKAEWRCPAALEAPGGWYDFTVHMGGEGGHRRRYAGRIDRPGATHTSDPAMGGPAVMGWA